MSIGKNLIFVSSAEQEGLLIGHCQKIFASFSEELKAKVIEDLKNSDIKSLEIRPAGEVALEASSFLVFIAKYYSNQITEINKVMDEAVLRTKYAPLYDKKD